jgi:hypothetical protein
MSIRKKWLLITAGSLVGMALCLVLATPREPRYQGRALRDWMADLSTGNYETQRLARIAIHEMGPAAVPFLTNSLAQRNALSIRFYRKSFIPKRIAAWSHRLLKWQTPMMESRSAAIALQALGPDATKAIPALVAALSDPSWTIAQTAAVALGAMGSNAVPALDRRLSLASPPELTWVLQAVTALGTNAAPLVPKLEPLLASEHNNVGVGASMALARIGFAAVPAVTNSFSNTNKAVLIRSLLTLQQIGPAALATTNSIVPLTRHSDPIVRLYALQALASIYPPREFSAPVWLAGLRDPDIRNVEISLRMLTIFPTNVRIYNREIARLTWHPTNSIREIASNSLTLFKAWPQ